MRSHSRLGRLAGLAAFLFVLLVGSANAATPTRTTISTTPQTKTTIGQTVRPLAKVAATADAGAQVAGTYDFYVCAQTPGYDGCATGGVALGTAGTGGGNVFAGGPVYTPPNPGIYCFRAEYTGSADHLPSKAGDQAGCVLVTTKVTLTYAYTSPPVVGQPFSMVFDLKDERGKPVPGSLVVGDGSDGGCSGGGPFAQTIPLVNGKATTRSFTPRSAVGLPVSWQLRSDAYVLLAGCTGVTPAAASTTSTLSVSSPTVSLGQPIVLTNQVTAAGAAGPPNGLAQFYVCGPVAEPAPCDGQTRVGNGVDVVNGTATSVGFTPKMEGTYCFRTNYYPVDGSYKESSTGAGPPTCAKLVRAGANLTFFLDPAGAVGEPVRIWAHVTRPGGTPTGRVRFFRCAALAGPEGCQNPDRRVDVTSELVDGRAPSVQFTTFRPGYSCMWAEYEGDAQTPGMTESGAAGCFRVQWGSTTTAYGLEGDVRLKGGKGPTGQRLRLGVATGKDGGANGAVSAWVCGPLPEPPGCASGGVALGSKALVGGGALADDIPATGPGYYCVRAEFTSSDPEVRDSSSTGAARRPNCTRVQLADKTVVFQPASKVEGQADPVPQLAGPADPSISGSPECTSAPHPEAPGTYPDVVSCKLGSMTSTDWVLRLGDSLVDLVITPRPTTPDPVGDGGSNATSGGGGAGQGASPVPGTATGPTGSTATPPVGGTGPTLPQSVLASDLATITGLTTRKGAVTLTLHIPGAGRVLVTVQAGKKRFTRPVSGAKAGSLTVKFSAEQLRKPTARVKRGKKVKLTVQARFTPAGGTARMAGPRTVSVKVA